MRQRARKSSLLGSLIAIGLITAVGLAQQRESEDPKPAVSEFRGRLPAYFSALVNREQRAEIYALQKRYHERIGELQSEIRDLEMERDKAVDAVLDPEQLAEVQKKRAAAEQRRLERRGARPPTESARR